MPPEVAETVQSVTSGDDTAKASASIVSNGGLENHQTRALCGGPNRQCIPLRWKKATDIGVTLTGNFGSQDQWSCNLQHDTILRAYAINKGRYKL